MPGYGGSRPETGVPVMNFVPRCSRCSCFCWAPWLRRLRRNMPDTSGCLHLVVCCCAGLCPKATKWVAEVDWRRLTALKRSPSSTDKISGAEPGCGQVRISLRSAQHPDVRKHQRIAAFGGADQVRSLIVRHAKIRTQADWVCAADRESPFMKAGYGKTVCPVCACGAGSGPRLATGHAIVQRILATTKRQAARCLIHDRNDLAHNVTAVAAGGIFEQIAHRGADLRLGVVWTAKIPIDLI